MTPNYSQMLLIKYTKLTDQQQVWLPAEFTVVFLLGKKKKLERLMSSSGSTDISPHEDESNIVQLLMCISLALFHESHKELFFVKVAYNIYKKYSPSIDVSPLLLLL